MCKIKHILTIALSIQKSTSILSCEVRTLYFNSTNYSEYKLTVITSYIIIALTLKSNIKYGEAG